MINEYRPGMKVTDFFLVRKKELRTRRDSEDLYLSLELTDPSGRIFGSFWNHAEKWCEKIDVGAVVKVRASVITWKGRLHLSITRIRLAEAKDKIDLDKFLPRGEANVQHVKQELVELVNTVKNDSLARLLKSFYADTSFLSQFCLAPGGKLWHHCYVNGLAEHTLFVAQLSMKIADIYSVLNRDLLLTGALLHDIGKIWEYTTAGCIEFSDQGRLHGHIAIGYHKVYARIEKIKDFPKSLADQVLHLILAHQGLRDQGSPVVPMTREAFILYFADEIDSKMNAFERIALRDDDTGSNWSRFVNLMERFLYIGDGV